MSITESFVKTPLRGELVEVIISAKSVSAPLCRKGQTSALAGIEVIITIIIYMGKCQAVRPAEIIKDSFSPFCFCSGSLFARTTSPLESVFIIIGFLYGFKVQIIGAVFITDTPPGKIPSFSSLIIFCNGITICIIIIIFIDPVENRSTQGITVGIDPWLRIGQLIIFTMPCSAKFPVKIYFITSSAEIGISQFENTDHAVRIGVPRPDSNNPGLLFNNINFYRYVMVSFRTGKKLHIYIFKIP